MGGYDGGGAVIVWWAMAVAQHGALWAYDDESMLYSVLTSRISWCSAYFEFGEIQLNFMEISTEVRRYVKEKFCWNLCQLQHRTRRLGTTSILEKKKTGVARHGAPSQSHSPPTLPTPPPLLLPTSPTCKPPLPFSSPSNTLKTGSKVNKLIKNLTS